MEHTIEVNKRVERTIQYRIPVSPITLTFVGDKDCTNLAMGRKTLANRILKLAGVANVEYNTKFGSEVYINVTPMWDGNAIWNRIDEIIKRYIAEV